MEKPKRSGEFDLIARCFAPLAKNAPGAFGLTDDVAVLGAAADEQIVVKTDCVVEGVHFPKGAPPEDAAPKALRVNLSDLAAKGARPTVYTLAAVFGPDVDDAWIEGFAAALARDQETYGIHLIGGDSAATPGPSMFSITAFGVVPASHGPIRRNGAKPGDRVWVSGTVGDAALGLLALEGGLGALDDDLRRMLIERYHRPTPRLALGPALRGIAGAALDVSDGLIGDLGHIAETSGVDARVVAADVPLSDAARRALAAEPALMERILTGGDDYEILFTARPAESERVRAAARAAGIPVAEIGEIRSRAGSAAAVVAIGADGRPLGLKRGGYAHS